MCLATLIEPKKTKTSRNSRSRRSSNNTRRNMTNQQETTTTTTISDREQRYQQDLDHFMKDDQYLLRGCLNYDWGLVKQCCSSLIRILKQQEQVTTLSRSSRRSTTTRKRTKTTPEEDALQSLQDKIVETVHKLCFIATKQIVATDRWGNTPLHAACYHKPPLKIIRALLKVASLVQLQQQQQPITATTTTNNNGHTNNNGYDSSYPIYSMKNYRNTTPLILACMNGASRNVIDELLRCQPLSDSNNGNGVIVTEGDKDGQSVFLGLLQRYEMNRFIPSIKSTYIPLDQVIIDNDDNNKQQAADMIQLSRSSSSSFSSSSSSRSSSSSSTIVVVVGGGGGEQQLTSSSSSSSLNAVNEEILRCMVGGEEGEGDDTLLLPTMDDGCDVPSTTTTTTTTTTVIGTTVELSSQSLSSSSPVFQKFWNVLDHLLQSAWWSTHESVDRTNHLRQSFHSMLHATAYVSDIFPTKLTNMIIRNAAAHYHHYHQEIHPLHLAITTDRIQQLNHIHPRLIYQRKYFIDQLLIMDPSSALQPVPQVSGGRSSRSPLCQAIASGLTWHIPPLPSHIKVKEQIITGITDSKYMEQGPLQSLWNCSPEALYEPDSVTGLYPFMLAASVAATTTSTATTTATAATIAVVTPSTEEEEDVDNDDDVNIVDGDTYALDTIYHLLRLYPQVVIVE